MTCARCATHMLTSHHRECEDVGGAMLLTDVVLNECPVCSALVKVIMPLIPPYQEEHA
jgi:hypothetical protein